MTTISAFQSGFQAIQQATNVATQNAAQIASNSQSTEDLTRALVSLDAQKQQVQAASHVIQSYNEMVGTLLDMTV